METRHFIKTWCKQKVKIFFLSTLISLNPKWVPRFTEFHRTFISISKIIYVVQHLLVNASETCELKHMYQIRKRDPANICWSWKRLQHVFKTSLRRLQHVFSVTILRLPKRLEDVLKTSWRHLGRRLEDVLKTLWRKAKYLLGISVSNKSKCVSNKSIFNKSTFDNSKANPKCIK